MYAALNQTGILIYAQDAMPNQTYYCCSCNQRVKLIWTKSSQYFRHISQVNNQKNETQIHKAGKQLIASALDSFDIGRVESEVYLPKIQQRPDILINQKVAIEYQCAKINVTTLEQRVLGYRRLGMANLWILGGGYLSPKLHREHLKFVSFNRNLGFHLLMLDSTQQLLTIFYHIRFVGPFNKIYFQKTVLARADFGRILTFHPPTNALVELEMNPYTLQKLRTKNDPESQRIKMEFYIRYNLTIEDYLQHRRFKSLPPIYRYPAWQMACGQNKELLHQPLLNLVDTKRTSPKK